MFGIFFRFEVRYWLRGFLVWVFFLVLTAMFFGSASTDNITVGMAVGNTYRNAPFVIQNNYAIAGLLSLLMTTAFVNAAATREFAHNMHQIVFSSPLRKWSFLLGRYWGAALISIIPLLSVSAGNLLATFMPWNDPVRWGPTPWHAHFWGIVTFAIPNTLFVAAILFSVAMLTRSTMASFLSGLMLMIAYAVSAYFMDKLENEPIAALLDPFAVRTFGLVTKYWTVAEKNTIAAAPTGLLLWNRLLWMGVGAVVFVVSAWRFSFAERTSRKRKTSERQEASFRQLEAMPQAHPTFGGATLWNQLRSTVTVEFWSMVKSTIFLVLLVAAVLNVLPSLIFSAREVFGNSSLPVTYQIISIIRGTLYLFLISIISFFAGALVWKERDARWDEISDALPTPNFIPFLAKLTSLLVSIALIELLCVFVGIGVQTYHGYHRYQLELYASEIFFWDFLTMECLAALAFFCHVLSPSKYVGYFAFIAFLIANAFAWNAVNVETHLAQFASTPSYRYSDLFHYGPYLEALGWFNAYWWIFSALLGIATILLWPRGKEVRLPSRLSEAGRNWKGPIRLLTLVLAVIFLSTGVWAYYNTKIEHELMVGEDRKQRQADYEKAYKKYADLPQPRTQSVKYTIDLYPEAIAMTLKGEQIIKNVSTKPIGELHLNLAQNFDTTVEVPGGKVKLDDKRLLYRIYELSAPLQPGDSKTLRYTVKYQRRGFENEVSVREINQNGTFFNNQIAPQIGYLAERGLDDKNDRRKKGLPEKDLMPPLERNCTDKCRDTYISRHADWVDVETVFSTSPDQVAVAPGSLLREWTENGRRFFHYKLDHSSMNFYSFISARYQVAREDWNGVKVEVYYHPEHAWNVPKMVTGVKKALEYCSTFFGPYGHKQARIIEFPRVASFAQAFPGTMPYSEAIGFIADLQNPDDIDQVMYVVAHEIAHQWWAHQVIGARMQGATLLSETLAQYSALMVMEKEYGRDMMRKFLAYEMDRYLRGRGREMLKERPLMRVEASQGYIHYSKGSVAMYYLKEMIGEDAVNRALRGIVQKYGYGNPPYPTSYDLLDALREQTPLPLQYLLRDLFEDITLFSNRTTSAKAAKRPDGKYDVTIEVEARKFKGDETGAEKEARLDDYIEIGAFAAPAEGKKYGTTLYRERRRITQERNRFSFVVASFPQKAGIDPFSLLVDRVPDDNLKKVDVE